MKIRAHILRRLIVPFNWHKDGQCRFPVLCMYDDLLIWDLSGYNKGKHATWSEARRLRQEIDREFRKLRPS